MQIKLTIGERLKDLRTAQKLTLEQLAAEVGISKSALGKYESDNGKDISPYSILVLADYYGVSCDYLMGRTETKNHPNTALHELHLSDASIDVLKTGKFNHRLLSELICHKDFQRFMLDAEIYVDRIADMRVNDMNAVLEAVRQMALMKNGGEENDLHLRTLEVAQIREDEYFGSLIADDLKGILRDIRSEHRPDTMTADEVSFAENIQNQLRDAMNFEGSSEEKKAIPYVLPHPKYSCIRAFFNVSSFSRLWLMIIFVFSVCSTKAANCSCNSIGGIGTRSVRMSLLEIFACRIPLLIPVNRFLILGNFSNSEK